MKKPEFILTVRSKAVERRWSRLLPAASIALALAGFLLLPVAAASNAATAAPFWHLTQRSYPENFSPGASPEVSLGGAYPKYQFIATNTGAASTSGPITFTDVLPSGLTPLGPTIGVVPTGPQFSGGGYYYNSPQENEEEPCAVSGQRVTCQTEKGVPAHLFARIIIPVEVSPQSGGVEINEGILEGGGAAAARAVKSTLVSEDIPGIGFSRDQAGASAGANEADGTQAEESGSHPYQVTIDTGFPGVFESLREGGPKLSEPAFHPKTVSVSLPRGMVIDPTATPVRCTAAELERSNSSVAGVDVQGCPAASQVGVAAIETQITGIYPSQSPLYNMVPPPGAPAELAFSGLGQGIYVHLIGHVNSDGSYELSASSSETLARPFDVIFGVELQLWGNPSDPSHHLNEGAKVEPETRPFITMPGHCATEDMLTGNVEGWEDPGFQDLRTFSITTPEEEPSGLTGCGSLPFDPSLDLEPSSTEAESAVGVSVDLHQPQQEAIGTLANSDLKDARVTLPPEMTINPSSASGLSGCDESQIGYAPQGGQIRFSESPQTCPAASKIGRVRVTTPLLEHELEGSIFVASPFENPFDSLLAIYLAVEDAQTGIVSKLAGKVEPDPATGQITASFAENPELPLEDVDLDFFPGDRAVLQTPLSCSDAVTSGIFTPWSTPEGSQTRAETAFRPGPGCASSGSAAPKVADFSAGTVGGGAGTFSPFVFRLARPDRSQHISSISVTLPEGLLGRLAGVPYCPESAIEQARRRENADGGSAEQSSPSCPAASQVGTLAVSAGVGPTPLPVSGHVYLAGPYKGAPVSLVAVVPAVAGPFDLGTVVNRVALYVDEFDAQIHAKTDPLPSILDGIPLDLRSIDLDLNRPGFTLDPTSCEPKSFEGSYSTPAGQSSAFNAGFQVRGCGRLAFKPRLKLSLRGATGRSGHPSLKAVLRFPDDAAQSNTKRAQVTLPKSEFLDQSDIANACTKALLIVQKCAAGSVYGHATAWSPLLAEPLTGPVYLVGGFGYKLPALVAELNGQIRILLVGKVDSGPHGGIRTTFESVPDAPVSRFVLQLKGGRKYGLLQNSVDICRQRHKAGFAAGAQNGRRQTLEVAIHDACRIAIRRRTR